MEPLIGEEEEESPADSQICYWFERIPHEIREILMANLNIGSFLNLMQCSSQFHQELNNDSLLILGRYDFCLSLDQRANFFELVLRCETKPRCAGIPCYEGTIGFKKLSENSTKVKITRYRFPHRNIQSSNIVKYKHTELGWIENKNVNDLVVQYMTSYIKTFGKYMYKLDINVDPDIAVRMNGLFVDVTQFEKLSEEIKIDGPNITVDQLMKLNTATVRLTNMDWSKTEVLKLIKIWRDGQLNPNITTFLVRVKFDYDEEIEEYIRSYMSKFQCEESPGVIYDFVRSQFETKVVVNREKCTLTCDFFKKRTKP